MLDWFRRLRAKIPERRVVDVGWLLQTESAGFIWERPRDISRQDADPTHAKSVAYCPAVLDHEARLWEVPCPFDLQLRFRVDEGKPVLVNVAGDHSAMRPKHMGQTVTLISPREWRHPKRPIVQIYTPYVFVADEPVYLSQMPPFIHYRDPPLPGVLIGGRIPIHIWPRQLMWAFEWYDTSKELVLERGEPWFYVRFETPDAARQVRLVDAELTPELDTYLKGLSGVANYVKRTYSLFSTAKQRRPRQLLVRRRHGS